MTSKYGHRMWLDVTNAGHTASDSVVTSLRARKTGGLRIQQYPFGGVASTGDLELGLDLAFEEKYLPEGLPHAVGEITGDTITKTSVVSKLRVNSRILKIQSQAFDGNYHHGAITISDPTGAVGAEVPVEATHLHGVEEVLLQDTIGLAFTHEKPTSLLTQLLVPYDDLFEAVALSIRLGLLTSRIGNISSSILKLSYRIIKNPTEKNQIVNAFPQTEMTDLACDFKVINLAYANGYYFVESEAVTVSPGDLFILKIERRPPDGYADRLILLRKSGILNFV